MNKFWTLALLMSLTVFVGCQSEADKKAAADKAKIQADADATKKDVQANADATKSAVQAGADANKTKEDAAAKRTDDYDKADKK